MHMQACQTPWTNIVYVLKLALGAFTTEVVTSGLKNHTHFSHCETMTLFVVGKNDKFMFPNYTFILSFLNNYAFNLGIIQDIFVLGYITLWK